MGMFLRRGLPPERLGALPEGSIIKLNVSGAPWEFLIVQQGLPSDVYDASCDGTWLLMKDCYDSRAWGLANNNAYASSSINAWLNADFLALLDSNIQSTINQAKIPYISSGTVQQGEDGLLCKSFLLSAPEVNIAFRTINPDEGAALKYFANCPSSGAAPKRVAMLASQATQWWLRSPNTGTSSVWSIKTNGEYLGTSASTSCGIRPAFIMPSDFRITDYMLA